MHSKQQKLFMRLKQQKLLMRLNSKSFWWDKFIFIQNFLFCKNKFNGLN